MLNVVEDLRRHEPDSTLTDIQIAVAQMELWYRRGLIGKDDDGRYVLPPILGDLRVIHPEMN